MIKNIFLAGLVLWMVSIWADVSAYTVNYNHPALTYTSTGVTLYSLPAKTFLAKWFSGQVDYIKSFKNGLDIKYAPGQKGDILGSKNNDYFHGFNNYNKNNLVWGEWDDFYDIQLTYPIVEKVGGWIDTYLVSGNTGPGKENVENIISRWAWGRIYGDDSDNVIITEWLRSEVHGWWWNDVFLANGLRNTFYGDRGVDTIVFPGSVRDYVIYGDDWSVTVKNIKTGGIFTIWQNTIEQYQFDDAFFGSEAGDNTLSVGPTRTFHKLSDALRVAGNGDVIEVDSWVYEDDFAIIGKSVTIVGKNGKAHFVAKSPSFKGKANFITMSANVTFDNIEFSGNRVADKNGAGIRLEGGIPWGIITVKNCYFHNNEVAILWGNQANGVLNIENTEFGYNGHISGGNPHTVNVGIMKELNVKNSFFHNSINGHNIRSLADSLSVTDSFFYDGTANTSLNIEAARSLSTRIFGNTFVQTEIGENTHMILNTATVSSVISENVFVNNASRWEAPIRNKAHLWIRLDNNRIYNYKDFISGNNAFTGTGNTILSSVHVIIPPSAGVVASGSVSPVVEMGAEFNKAATLADFTGKTITVGAGKNYRDLKTAVLNALSGDKIYVDEGVYPSDYVQVSNKNLAIIGLGKWAEFKKVSAIPNGKAIFTSSKSNLYVKNILFSDAEVPDKNGAGIRYEEGTLTVEDCVFKNNENGILGGATPVWKWKIWINRSQFLNNGRNGTGYTHAIYIGEMDFAEIKNSVVKGTQVGHHIKSRARTTMILNNILDDAGGNASYNIDLPNGGNGLIKGNIITQSVNSPNRTIVSYSAEKNPTNPGKLTIEENTFASEWPIAIGVKNFRDNPVILRNNVFNNVSTPYIGK